MAKSNNKLIKIGVIITVLCLVAAIVSALFIRGKSTYRMTEAGYQIVNGEKVEIDKGLRITVRDGFVTASQEKRLNRSPIYLKSDRNTIMLAPNYMVVQLHRKDALKKLGQFSFIEKNGDNCSLIKRFNSIHIKNAFLYDGEDVYVFLKPTTVVYGSNEITVGALSYVYAPYQKAGGIYDFSQDRYIDIPEGTANITARLDDGYIAFLDTDRLQGDGSGQIICRKPDNLKSFKG